MKSSKWTALVVDTGTRTVSLTDGSRWTALVKALRGAGIAFAPAADDDRNDDPRRVCLASEEDLNLLLLLLGGDVVATTPAPSRTEVYAPRASLTYGAPAPPEPPSVAVGTGDTVHPPPPALGTTMVVDNHNTEEGEEELARRYERQLTTLRREMRNLQEASAAREAGWREFNDRAEQEHAAERQQHQRVIRDLREALGDSDGRRTAETAEHGATLLEDQAKLRTLQGELLALRHQLLEKATEHRESEAKERSKHQRLEALKDAELAFQRTELDALKAAMQAVQERAQALKDQGADSTETIDRLMEMIRDMTGQATALAGVIASSSD